MGRLIDEIEIYKRLRPKVDNGTLDEIMLDIPTVEAIPIPNGATNGDIIETLFPNAEFEVVEKVGSRLFYMNDERHIAFDLDWWNAPYIEADTFHGKHCPVQPTVPPMPNGG